MAAPVSSVQLQKCLAKTAADTAEFDAKYPGTNTESKKGTSDSGGIFMFYINFKEVRGRRTYIVVVGGAVCIRFI